MKKTADSPKASLVPRILPRGRHKLDPQLVAVSERPMIRLCDPVWGPGVWL